MNRKSIGFGLALALVGAAWIFWRRTEPQTIPSEQARSPESARQPSATAATLASHAEPESVGTSSDQGGVAAIASPDLPRGAVSPSAPTSSRGITLHGVVTGKSSGRIRFDEVLCPTDAYQPRAVVSLSEGETSLSARLDDEGGYAFVGLPPGHGRIEARVCGYRPWECPVELLESSPDQQLDIALEAETILRVRIVLEPENPEIDPRLIPNPMKRLDTSYRTVHAIVMHRIPGRILEAGDGEAELNLTTAVRERQELDESGSLVIRESIQLCTDLPLYAAVVVGDRVLQSRLITSVEQEAVFSVPFAQVHASLGSVRFHVVDENRHALAQRGLCRLTRLSGSESLDDAFSGAESASKNAESSESDSGEVCLRDLHAGALGIEFWVQGYARLRLETVVDPGLERDLGEFRLERAVTIRGRVENADGSPAMGVDVRCGTPREEGDNPSPFSAARKSTDSNGGFMFYDLGKDSYVLRAYSGDRNDLTSSPVRVTTEGGCVEGVLLRLLPTVSVIVKLEGSLRGHVTLRVDDAQGMLVERQEASRARRATLGEFALVSGSYVARALLDGHELATAEFVVAEKPLRVTLVPR